jgi:hypothetical protein
MNQRPGQQLAIVRLSAALALAATAAAAQPCGQPDRGAPGGATIQAYLRRETEKIAARHPEDLASRGAWEAKRPQYVC